LSRKKGNSSNPSVMGGIGEGCLFRIGDYLQNLSKRSFER
jgi:hypothetical protein